MKKISLMIAMLVVHALPVAVWAVDLHGSQSNPFTYNYTLLNAATSTGQGSAQCFSFYQTGEYTPISKHYCMASWSGTVPTSISLEVDCSNDASSAGLYPTGSNACASVTMTSSPWPIMIDKPSIICVKGNYVSKVGGDATTSLTMTCTSGGQ